MVKLGRPFTSLLGALAVLTAAIVAIGLRVAFYATPIILGMATVFLFTMASNALNDYFDRDIDKINHPERPIPSGKILPRHALNFSISMLSISILMAFCLGAFLGSEIFAVFLTAFVFQIVYEMRFKRNKFVGNITIGFQTMLAFLFGGAIAKAVVPVTILAAAALFSVTGREVVKDIEDITGDTDRLTLPKVVGARKAGIIASSLVILAILISLLPYYPLHFFGAQYLLLILLSDSLFIYSIPIIFQCPEKARRTLKFAMLIAMISFTVGGIFQ